MANIYKILFAIIIMVMVTSCSTSENDMGKITGDGTQCTPIADFLQFGKNGSIRAISINDCDSKDGPNCSTVNGKKVCEQIQTNCKKIGILQWMDKKITGTIKTASLVIWLKLTLNIEFRWMLSMMLTVSVLLFAGSILLGITQASGYNIVMYMFKLIIIYQLTVNYIYFNIYVIQSFEALLSDVLYATALTFSDYVAYSDQTACLAAFGAAACNISGTITSLFGFDLLSLLGIKSDSQLGSALLFNAMDGMLSQMFDFRYWKLILTLSASGNTGIFYGIMMFVMVIAYLSAIVIAAKTFFMALIARWVLYGLGPIFLSFALFNQTRSLFDGWLQQLINFTLQPMFLFIFLGMFQSMLSGFMSQLYVDIASSTANLSYPAYCDTNGSSEPNGAYDWTCTSCTNGKPVAASSGHAGFNCECAEPDSSNQCSYRWVTGSSAGMCIKYTNKIDKAGSNSLKWFKLCSDGGNNCSDTYNPVIPVDIWMVISIIIVCYMMAAMCHWVTSIAAQLSSGMVSLSDVKVLGWDKLKGAATTGVKSIVMGRGGGGDSASR